MKFNIKVDFKQNEWVGFEMGYGEFFNPNKKELINDPNADFLVKTISISDEEFETTLIPNPIHKKDTSKWDCEESIKLFSSARTYKTSLKDVAKELSKSNSIGIYEIYKEGSSEINISITDFYWYFLGLSGAGIESIEMKPENHPLYNELIN